MHVPTDTIQNFVLGFLRLRFPYDHGGNLIAIDRSDRRYSLLNPLYEFSLRIVRQTFFDQHIFHYNNLGLPSLFDDVGGVYRNYAIAHLRDFRRNIDRYRDRMEEDAGNALSYRRNCFRVVLGVLSTLLPDLNVRVTHSVGGGFSLSLSDPASNSRPYNFSTSYNVQLINHPVAQANQGLIQPSSSVAHVTTQSQIFMNPVNPQRVNTLGLLSGTASEAQVSNRVARDGDAAREGLIPLGSDAPIVCNSTSMIVSRNIGPSQLISNPAQQSATQINTMVQQTNVPRRNNGGHSSSCGSSP